MEAIRFTPAQKREADDASAVTACNSNPPEKMRKTGAPTCEEQDGPGLRNHPYDPLRHRRKGGGGSGNRLLALRP